MKVETTGVSAQLINANFVRKLEEGRIKEAQSEASAFIRSKLRQTSFAREVLPPVVLADDELDRDVNTDLPRKIVEKEPDSTATFATFKYTPERTWFSGPRYAVYFGKISTPAFTKSKYELMTYQNDIRKILTDNSVKDMSDIEDGKFIEVCEAVVSGVADQDLSGSAPLTADSVVQAIKAHYGRKQPIGKIVMTKELYADVIKLPATSIGNDVASQHYTEGIEEEQTLWGYPVITTIKNDIIPNNVFWIFSPENYLGNFFLLDDATLFIKQEADIITFFSYSAPGIGIGNNKAITKMTLS